MAGPVPAIVHPMIITPQIMLSAYSQGLFPMAEGADSPELGWYDPPLRGVLPVGGIHASRSTLRDLRNGGWTATLNGDFAGTVRVCANREPTWINEALFRLYCELHEVGHACSFEVFRKGEFAGAMFGLTLRGAFFGESMMSAQTNGSKMALLWASSTLKNSGFRLFDTQFLTPHLASLGGYEVTREAYHARLADALSHDAGLPAELVDAQSLLQEIAQIS